MIIKNGYDGYQKSKKEQPTSMFPDPNAGNSVFSGFITSVVLAQVNNERGIETLNTMEPNNTKGDLRRRWANPNSA